MELSPEDEILILKELIDSIIRSNYIKIKQKDIKLILNNIEDAYVWYDQIHIEEVFSNFFVNALNHSTGSISVDMLKKDKILKEEQDKNEK